MGKLVTVLRKTTANGQFIPQKVSEEWLSTLRCLKGSSVVWFGPMVTVWSYTKSKKNNGKKKVRDYVANTCPV